nr:MAG TPA: adenine specific DNA methyltransferase [Caudoviricetes sp.]
MNIQMLKLSDIKPYENNPRKNNEAVKYVAQSIKEFGFKVPIVIDKNNVIIAGHTRYKAAKRLKMKEVPTIIADDLTDEQVKAFRLADNKVAEKAEWNFDLLPLEINDIVDIDMGAFGFDLDFNGGVEEQVQEDNFEIEPPKEPKAKLGDIYQLGRHRLMCGDSTSIEDVEKLLTGNKMDMLFTDPPYGYNYQSNMRIKSEKFDVLENDDKILDFMKVTQNYIKGFVFVCTTWKVLGKWLSLFNDYYNLTNMIIWDKGGGGIGDLKHTFSTDYEIILCSNNEKELTGKRIGSVWKCGKDNATGYVHPTQKPIELSATAIKNTSLENDNILDVFGGSGSTLMACEQLNRNCYMMELDPKYIDVIIERWEQFTGEKAVLIESVEK